MSTYIPSSVGTITDIDKIAKLGRVDLLILRGDQKAGDTDELKLRSGDFLALQESIDEVDGQVEGLRDKLKLEMDFDQPIDQDSTHAFVDVRLGLHVGRTDRRRSLLAAKVRVHVLDVRGDAQRIILVTKVDVVDVSSDLVRGWIGTKHAGIASGGRRITGFHQRSDGRARGRGDGCSHGH